MKTLAFCLSLLWSGLLSVVALSALGIRFVLPLFGDVTLWQVVAYIGSPLSLLPPAQQNVVRTCYGVGALVLVLSCVASCLLMRWFVRRFGRQGFVASNVILFLLTVETGWLTFEYVDFHLGVRYELRCRVNSSPLFRKEFRKVDPWSVDFPSGKRSLIVFAGESIEESFIDGSAFGTNLMPRLGRWWDAHATFGTMDVVHGCDHTICALFGMVYGVPRLAVDGVPRFVSFSDYPEVKFPSAWRVWLENGFACRFIKGGAIGFACTDKVFRAVPEVVVHDQTFYSDDPDYANEPHQHSFGVHDEVVIEKRLKGETLELAASGKPFVLMVWTLNTHSPAGWAASSKPPRHPVVLADAVMKADDTIVDYLEWFGRQPFAGRTDLVFVGDHVFHGYLGDIDKAVRHPVNAFALSGRGREPKVCHEFAAFDLAPTFLELTGANLPDGRFGLGTSLLRDSPTLLERIGRKRYEEEIRACIYDYRQLALEKK